jgi:hypothetical protein
MVLAWLCIWYWMHTEMHDYDKIGQDVYEFYVTEILCDFMVYG